MRCKGDEVKSKGEYLEEQAQTEQDLPLILKLWDKWTRPKFKKNVVLVKKNPNFGLGILKNY